MIHHGVETQDKNDFHVQSFFRLGEVDGQEARLARGVPIDLQAAMRADSNSVNLLYTFYESLVKRPFRHLDENSNKPC